MQRVEKSTVLQIPQNVRITVAEFEVGFELIINSIRLTTLFEYTSSSLLIFLYMCV